MKKSVIILTVAALVMTIGMSAYAYYGHRGVVNNGAWGGMYHRGGMMYGGRGGMQSPRGGMTYGGRSGKWNAAPNATCPCGTYGPGYAPGMTPQTAPQPVQTISEEKAREAAETYVTQYLPGYTVESVAKDSWRPLYVVTLKGENAEQIMTIHGFSGTVMHVFPKTTTQ